MTAYLEKLQQPNGLFYHGPEGPFFWGSAMFGYAMQVGVKKGLLPVRPYRKAVERAWKGLCQYLEDNGDLREVCVGTGQSTDINYYLSRPRITGDLHGQAPLLWFACSLLNTMRTTLDEIRYESEGI